MAIQTLGTSATTSLNLALVWQSNAASQADVADINQAILDDVNPRHPVAQISGTGGFIREGNLFVPNRGVLQLRPGDVVALDSTSGQVILLTAYGLSAGPWVLT